MPLTVSNPRDLYLMLLGDILFVERQLSFEVLPELIKQVQDADLAGVLGDHVEPTKRHAETLEHVFRLAGAEPSSNHSDPFVALVDQHKRLSGSILEPSLADAFHANAAAHTEHYEIGAYRALIPLARTLGQDEAAGLLEANLADEEQALAQLERLGGRVAGAGR
jgi:ferritin-like metal-binding protein YciE